MFKNGAFSVKLQIDHIFNLTFNHIFNVQPSVHIMAVEILNLKSQGDFTSDKKRQLRPSEEHAA